MPDDVREGNRRDDDRLDRLGPDEGSTDRPPVHERSGEKLERRKSHRQEAGEPGDEGIAANSWTIHSAPTKVRPSPTVVTIRPTVSRRKARL